MEVKIERISNPQLVHWDTSSTEFDASDWGYAFVSDFMKDEEFESKYPKAEKVEFSGGDRVFHEQYLEENITHNLREKGEFQLTSCLDRLRQEDGFSGYIVKGRRFDVGVPDAYRQAMMDYGNL